MTALLVAISHRDPAISDDRVGLLDRFERIARDANAPIIAFRPIHELARGREFRWRRNSQIEIEAYRRMNPAGKDVIRIAAPGDRAPLNETAMFLERQNV